MGVGRKKFDALMVEEEELPTFSFLPLLFPLFFPFSFASATLCLTSFLNSVASSHDAFFFFTPPRGRLPVPSPPSFLTISVPIPTKMTMTINKSLSNYFPFSYYSLI
ncbi:hypothetical protein, unlikely [Trypanosoma brucei gambiense DAL972]|uniref:Uncharacterized protein n=1 Tax=Trypanosoma brucei gambiense (strain MHOM/CI/86/DAL972) TaxID=679716 RepID=C9ZSZ3_TRYB9|nr:hypothetical protein, unlikely [Trypanosoma brucei gambiense DAL972]CBH12528.1 hypothetical protein, unlikely [Trypanosoma brucei gambiense DAL972]|eukprot:XP_011774808.1 hypothetical protein, unlikely [Trypanosoma brucei gambiense DAL972]